MKSPSWKTTWKTTTTLAALALIGQLAGVHDLRAEVAPSLEKVELLEAPALSSFIAEHGEEWEVSMDRRSERPFMLQGAGVPLLPGARNDLAPADVGLPSDGTAQLADVERLSREFLAAHPELLQVGEFDLRLDPVASTAYGEGNAFWVLTLQQHHEGVPVVGAEVYFYVDHGNIVQFGASRVAEVELDPTPWIGRDVALEIALGETGLTAPMAHVVEPGRLEIVPVTAGAPQDGYDHRLTWHFEFRVGDRLYSTRVDAQAGELLESVHRAAPAPMLANAFPISRIGQSKASCVAPPSSLRGWWPLDDTSGGIADELVDSKTGVHVNGPTPVTGRVSVGLDLDGVNDYVQVADCSNFDIAAGDFTFDAWIRTNDYFGTILDKRTKSGSTYRGYLFMVNSGRLLLQIADDVNNWFNYTTTSMPAVNNGAWRLVAVSVDRDNPTGGRMYIDGSLVYVFNPTNRQGNASNNADLLFGRSGVDSPNYLDGTLDEVEIFKRALSATEIQGLWNAGAAGKCKNTQLPTPPRCTEVSDL